MSVKEGKSKREQGQKAKMQGRREERKTAEVKRNEKEEKNRLLLKEFIFNTYSYFVCFCP